MLTLPLSLALLSLGAGGDPPPERPAATVEPLPIVVGSRIPDWVLPPIEGGAPVSLHSLFGGRPTLLHIYASW